LGPGRRRAAVIHGMRVFKIGKRLAFLLVVLTRPSFRRPLIRDTVNDPDKRPSRPGLARMSADTHGGVVGAGMLRLEMNRPGFVGDFILWKRGWNHGQTQQDRSKVFG